MVLTNIIQMLNANPTDTVAVVGLLVSFFRNKRAIANKFDLALCKFGVLVYSCFHALVLLVAIMGSSVGSSSAETAVAVSDSILFYVKLVFKFTFLLITGQKSVEDSLFFVTVKKHIESVKVSFKTIFNRVAFAIAALNSSFTVLSPVMIQ